MIAIIAMLAVATHSIESHYRGIDGAEIDWRAARLRIFQESEYDGYIE